MALQMYGKTYESCLQIGVDYRLLRTYGFFHRNIRPQSWYKGLWVIRGIVYEVFECIWVM